MNKFFTVRDCLSWKRFERNTICIQCVSNWHQLNLSRYYELTGVKCSMVLNTHNTQRVKDNRTSHIWEAQNTIGLNIAIILAYNYIRRAYTCNFMLNKCFHDVIMDSLVEHPSRRKIFV